MTLLSEGSVVAAGVADDVPPPSPTTAGRRVIAEHVAVVAALAWWATAVVNGTGGRDPGPLTVELALLAVAAGLTRPWRRTPVATAVGALVVVVASLVCVVAPGGWGAVDVTAYAAAALAFVIAASYASTTLRALVVVCAIVAAGFYEFTQSFIAWWGGGAASARMVGTFYWHNPFAAYLLAPALLALGLAVWRVRPVRLVGWLAAPFLVAGVVYSTSRASMAVLAVGWLAVGAVATKASLRHLGRWLLVTAVAAAVTFGLTQPPVFDRSTSPLAATQTRAAQQGLAQNGSARLSFWRQSGDVVEAYPFFGPGFREFGAAGRHLFRADEGRSSFVHNGYLQPFVDGGLTFGLVFMAALAGAFAAIFRRRRGHPVLSAMPWSVPAIALAVVLVHSGVDFDWTHPSNLVLAALLAGALAGRCGSPRRLWAHRIARPGLVVVVVLGLEAGVGAVWSRHATVDVQRARTATEAWHVVRSLDSVPFTGDGGSAALLARGIAPPSAPTHLDLTPVMWRHVLGRTHARADVDDRLAFQRAAGLAMSGHPNAAVSVVRAELRRLGGLAGPWAPDAASVLAATGHPDEARDVLMPYVRADIATRSPHTWLHVEALARVAPGTTVAGCAWQMALTEAPDAPTQPALAPPPPTAEVDCGAVLKLAEGRP